MYHASKVALSSVLTIAEYEVVNFNIANLGSLSHQNLEVNEALPISREWLALETPEEHMNWIREAAIVKLCLISDAVFS